MAHEINKREDVKLINVQHKSGIFGGSGEIIFCFSASGEKKPIIITFHLVLSDPDEKLKNVVRSIVNLKKAAVVMNKLSQEILENNYEIFEIKNRSYPHGIPQVPANQAIDSSKSSTLKTE